MKKFFSLLLSGVALCAQAQISNYEHPCTILGQERVAVATQEQFTPTIESLIIHDVDDNSNNPFKLKLLSGEHYKVVDGAIVPDANFEGTLRINLKVNDGKFESNTFIYKVQVGDATLSDAKAIYVATTGNDTNSGTFAAPVQSLQRAKELVATTGASVVYFRGGEYFMDKSVVFTTADSGTEEQPITYAAYKDEAVRFTGSVKLPYEQFEKATPEQAAPIEDVYVKAKIKVIDLKELGITDYGMIDHVGYGVRNQPLPAARLFVDGAAMQIARYPNVANYNDVGAANGLREFKSKSGIVHKWKQTGDIWIDGSMSKAWEWQKNKIASVAADTTITMQWDYHSDIATEDVKMFYFNMIEELDYPEEYFIDRKSGLLYTYFPASISERSDIRLTQSGESFIVLDEASHLTFKGIAFEGTRAAAIYTKRPSSYNTFDQCTVYSCGLEGIQLNGYGNRVENCLIHNVGASGVSMRGGDYKLVKPAGNIVENCIIHDFSQERRVYNAGIQMDGVGQVARHIELYNGPHMAARISGVNHILEYCDFHDAPHEYSDMLGVYLCTGGRFFDRGTIIRRNKFHDVSGTWKQSAGVYMDNETNGVVVEENYFYDNIAQDNGWSVMIHGGGDNMVRRNVFVDCSFPFLISTRLNGYAKGDFKRILERWEDQAQEGMTKEWKRAYPELLRYFDDGNRRNWSGKLAYKFKLDKEGNITNYWNMRVPTTNVFEGNLVYNADPATFVMPASRPNAYENRGYYCVGSFRVVDGEMQDALIHSNNHNATTNPGFVDYEEHNLQVKEGAAIAEQLPHLTQDYYNQMGLKCRAKVGAND